MALPVMSRLNRTATHTNPRKDHTTTPHNPNKPISISIPIPISNLQSPTRIRAVPMIPMIPITPILNLKTAQTQLPVHGTHIPHLEQPDLSLMLQSWPPGK